MATHWLAAALTQLAIIGYQIQEVSVADGFLMQVRSKVEINHTKGPL